MLGSNIAFSKCSTELLFEVRLPKLGEDSENPNDLTLWFVVFFWEIFFEECSVLHIKLTFLKTFLKKIVDWPVSWCIFARKIRRHLMVVQGNSLSEGLQLGVIIRQ